MKKLSLILALLAVILAVPAFAAEEGASSESTAETTAAERTAAGEASAVGVDEQPACGVQTDFLEGFVKAIPSHEEDFNYCDENKSGGSGTDDTCKSDAGSPACETGHFVKVKSCDADGSCNLSGGRTGTQCNCTIVCC